MPIYTPAVIGTNYVVHGTDATVLRPITPAPVRWIGSVQPNNGITDDLWVDKTGTPFVERVFDSAAWVALGSAGVVTTAGGLQGGGTASPTISIAPGGVALSMLSTGVQTTLGAIGVAPVIILGDTSIPVLNQRLGYGDSVEMPLAGTVTALTLQAGELPPVGTTTVSIDKFHPATGVWSNLGSLALLDATVWVQTTTVTNASFVRGDTFRATLSGITTFAGKWLQVTIWTDGTPPSQASAPAPVTAPSVTQINSGVDAQVNWTLPSGVKDAIVYQGVTTPIPAAKVTGTSVVLPGVTVAGTTFAVRSYVPTNVGSLVTINSTVTNTTDYTSTANVTAQTGSTSAITADWTVSSGSSSTQSNGGGSIANSYRMATGSDTSAPASYLDVGWVPSTSGVQMDVTVLMALDATNPAKFSILLQCDSTQQNYVMLRISPTGWSLDTRISNVFNTSDRASANWGASGQPAAPTGGTFYTYKLTHTADNKLHVYVDSAANFASPAEITTASAGSVPFDLTAAGLTITSGSVHFRVERNSPATTTAQAAYLRKARQVVYA